MAGRVSIVPACTQNARSNEITGTAVTFCWAALCAAARLMPHSPTHGMDHPAGTNSVFYRRPTPKPPHSVLIYGSSPHWPSNTAAAWHGITNSHMLTLLGSRMDPEANSACIRHETTNKQQWRSPSYGRLWAFRQTDGIVSSVLGANIWFRTVRSSLVHMI